MTDDTDSSLVNAKIDDAIHLLHYLRTTFYAQKTAVVAADDMARSYREQIGATRRADGLIPEALIDFEVERQKVRELVDEVDGPISDEERAFLEWFQYGLTKGWISETFCSTHEIEPLTEDEAEAFEEDEEPCISVARIWGVRYQICETYDPQDDL